VTLNLVIGALYVEVVPPWEAPDEPWHLTYAEAVADGRMPTNEETYESHQPPLYYTWVALGLRALGVKGVPRAPDNPWYPFAEAALWHEPGDPAVPLLAAIRTFSALLGSLAVVLAWAATRAARPGGVEPVLAALTVGLLPQFVFIGHAVSNDTLATAVGALVTYGLVVWVVRPGAARAAALLLAFAGAAAVLTKLNALVVLTAVVPAALVAAWRDRGMPTAQRVARSVGPVAGAAAGAGAAVCVLALVVPDSARAIAEQAAARGYELDPALMRPDVAAHLLRGTLVSLWARFGWLTIDLPWPLTAVAALAAAIGLLGALVAAHRGGDRLRRALLVSAAVVVVVLVAGARSSLADPQPQGRLLMPALAALGLVLSVGWAAVVPTRWHSAFVGAIGGFLVAANIVATMWSIPQGFAAWQGAMPLVDLRVIPSHRVVAADLAPAHAFASQTFAVGGPGLRRVEVPVAGTSGDGTLDLRLLSDDGTAVGRHSVSLSRLRANTWVGIDVDPARDSAGRSYVLTVELDATTPDARVRLWGSPDDAYAAGELVTSEHGAAGTDLMILTLLDDSTGD
jgi:4-amino-4-deoxy-L-arabinose transferase-like glycosyltransferase